jgi:DNA polymerase-3 subunit chi
VPHDLVTDAGANCPSPVVLTTGPLPANMGTGAALLNIGQTVPPFFELFARVAEILDARPEVRSAGRERFKAYRGKSIDPQTHNV